MENLSRILAEHPVFKDLESQYIDLLVGCASNIRFNPGTFVFMEGEEANQFYFIRRGNIVLEINSPTGPVEFQTLKEGDILGWAWLSPPYHWYCDANVTEPTSVIAFDGICLRTKCEKDKKLGYEFMKRLMPLMVQEFESTQQKIIEVARKDH